MIYPDPKQIVLKRMIYTAFKAPLPTSIHEHEIKRARILIRVLRCSCSRYPFTISLPLQNGDEYPEEF
jgi:hypothetical protein